MWFGSKIEITVGYVVRGVTTAEFKSRLPLKGLADQLNLYVCEVLYGEHTKGRNSRRRMPVRIQPQIPDLGIGPVHTIARLTDVIGWFCSTN